MTVEPQQDKPLDIRMHCKSKEIRKKRKCFACDKKTNKKEI